jgi:hypothetical protein
MTLTSTSDSLSIFKNGRLKSGIYKIQNVYAGTYLDITVISREVCCRPIGDLGGGRGLVRGICCVIFMYLTIGSGKLNGLGLDIRCRG